MSRIDTIDLIEQAKRGEQDAFNELLTRCAPRLLPYVRYRIAGSLRGQLESMDILQDVLIKSFRSFRGFRGATAGELLAWMTAMARNRVNDVARHYGRDMRDADREAPLAEAAEVPAQMASALTAAILSENEVAERSRLEAALDLLEPEDREIFLLHKLEELSFDAIGARLNKTGEACRKRLARAVAKITSELAPSVPNH